MNQRTRGAQPIARCGKCGGEDCAFLSELRPHRGVAMRPLRYVGPDVDIFTGGPLFVRRPEWTYTIECATCGWMWRQLVRETDTIEATSLTKVFSITGLVVAALILIMLASLNISIVGWR